MLLSTPQRTANGMAVAATAHALVFALFVTYARVPSQHDAASASAFVAQTLTWLADGPGGGRGGSGARQPEPAPPLRRAGHDNRTIPAPASTAPSAGTVVDTDPIVRVAIPVTPLGADAESEIGVIGAMPTFSQSRGPGDGGLPGSGRGGGNGPGDGPGAGRTRYDGGIGDGPGGTGANVTHPVAIHMERPSYSHDAMRARVQGTVAVECIVRPNGICSDIHVVRSLDRTFGLDEEAMRAAALWRFRPGTRFGQPVPVIVRIELEFTLR